MKTLLSVVALAVAASSPALQLNVNIDSTVVLTDAIVIYKSTAPGLVYQNGTPLGDIAAGPHTATINVAGDQSQYGFYRYSLLATYVSAVDGHTGVVVGLNPTSALAATGVSFESTFGASESSMITAIRGAYSGDPATLLATLNTLNAFADANLDKLPIGLVGGSLMAFSDGTPVGTVNAAPVPEPATFAALGWAWPPHCAADAGTRGRPVGSAGRPWRRRGVRGIAPRAARSTLFERRRRRRMSAVGEFGSGFPLPPRDRASGAALQRLASSRARAPGASGSHEASHPSGGGMFPETDPPPGCRAEGRTLPRRGVRAGRGFSLPQIAQGWLTFRPSAPR